MPIHPYESVGIYKPTQARAHDHLRKPACLSLPIPTIGSEGHHGMRSARQMCGEGFGRHDAVDGNRPEHAGPEQHAHRGDEKLRGTEKY